VIRRYACAILALTIVVFGARQAVATCGQTLTLSSVSGNVSVCFGGASGAYIPQQEQLDANGAILDSAAGTSNPGGRAIAIQGITSGVTVPVSAASLPLPSNAAQETGGNLANTYGAVGALGSSAASADTGSFNLNSFIQRGLQHLTTINTTLGSPMQNSGGSVSVLQSGNWTARIEGNGGATLDAAVGGAAAPTNGLAVGGEYNSSALSLSNGNFAALQLDSHGYLEISPNNVTQTQGSATSGQTGSLTMAAAVTSAPSNTTGDTYPIYEDLAGNVRTLATQTGTWTDRITGNGGATLDAGITGATAPTNGLAVGGQYNSSSLSLTNQQFASLQLDSHGYLEISPNNITIAQASTTSGQTGSLVMAAAVSSAPSNSNGDTYPVYEDLSGNMLVNCKAGCTSSTFADEGAFTAGTTNIGLSGGFYQTTATSNPLSTGEGGALQLTEYRAAMVSPFDTTGVSMSDTTTHAQKVEGTGTAGTAAAAVTTIQGIASMTPIFIEGNAGGKFDQATGSAVPANALYNGINVAGDIRGQTGVNPTGSVYAAQTDLTSVAGTTTVTAASGVQKVGVVGNAGTAFDAAAGSAATNAVAVQGTSGMLPVNTANQAAAANTDQGYALQVASTPTVTASSYSFGNCLGGFNAITVAGNNAQSGLVTNFRVSSVTGVTASVTVYLFEANPSSSTCTDHSTFTLNSADVDKLIMNPVNLSLVAPDGATPSMAEASFTPPRPFLAGGSGSSVKTIYYGMVATSTFTPGSTTDIHTRTGVVLN
jgi:hypothetical protein